MIISSSLRFAKKIDCAFLARDYLLSFHEKEQVTLSLACELMSADTVLIVQFTEHSSERSSACGFLSLDSWNVF